MRRLFQVLSTQLQCCSVRAEPPCSQPEVPEKMKHLDTFLEQ